MTNSPGTGARPISSARAFTRNPSVEPAVLPFVPTKKAAGDVIISTHRAVMVKRHDRFCRCRTCKPPLLASFVGGM